MPRINQNLIFRRVCPLRPIQHSAHILSTLKPTFNTPSLVIRKPAIRTLIYPTPSLNMRLPYVTDPVPTKTEEEAGIVERIRARREPRPLQALDLTLLHAPPIADGWNSFLGAVRTKNSLPDDVRELAISRIAVCNKAWYEWTHHAPLAVKGGVSEAGMEAIKQETLGERPAELTEKLWAVVLYTEEMTRNVQVKDETFDALRTFFSEKEIVELTATVSPHILHSTSLS